MLIESQLQRMEIVAVDNVTCYKSAWQVTMLIISVDSLCSTFICVFKPFQRDSTVCYPGAADVRPFVRSVGLRMYSMIVEARTQSNRRCPYYSYSISTIWKFTVFTNNA